MVFEEEKFIGWIGWWEAGTEELVYLPLLLLLLVPLLPGFVLLLSLF